MCVPQKPLSLNNSSIRTTTAADWCGLLDLICPRSLVVLIASTLIYDDTGQHPLTTRVMAQGNTDDPGTSEGGMRLTQNKHHQRFSSREQCSALLASSSHFANILLPPLNQHKSKTARS